MVDHALLARADRSRLDFQRPDPVDDVSLRALDLALGYVDEPLSGWRRIGRRADPRFGYGMGQTEQTAQNDPYSLLHGPVQTAGLGTGVYASTPAPIRNPSDGEDFGSGFGGYGRVYPGAFAAYVTNTAPTATAPATTTASGDAGTTTAPAAPSGLATGPTTIADAGTTPAEPASGIAAAPVLTASSPTAPGDGGTVSGNPTAGGSAPTTQSAGTPPAGASAQGPGAPLGSSSSPTVTTASAPTNVAPGTTNVAAAPIGGGDPGTTGSGPSGTNATAVPEPPAILLLTAGAVLALGFGRRARSG